jgi:sugar/nucleoside kinase (ribokinase family)
MTVVVVGDVMDDVLVRPRTAVSPGSDTESEIRRSPGGSGANQAAWLASLGVPVRFYGRCGAVDAGRHAAALRRAGVDARVAADAVEPTGTVVVLVAGDERSMFTDRAANRRLSEEDLPRSLEGVAHLHVSGYSLFDPSSRVHVAGLLRAARGSGVPVSVDPSSESDLRAVGPDEFLAMTDGAAIAFPNGAEARMLSGRVDSEAAAVALTEHYATVAVKLGAEGAILACRNGPPLHVAAEPVEVVDTTGAGDAFCAGFLAAFVRGAGPKAAARAAAATAARALTRLGARPPEC